MGVWGYGTVLVQHVQGSQSNPSSIKTNKQVKIPSYESEAWHTDSMGVCLLMKCHAAAFQKKKKSGNLWTGYFVSRPHINSFKLFLKSGFRPLKNIFPKKRNIFFLQQLTLKSCQKTVMTVSNALFFLRCSLSRCHRTRPHSPPLQLTLPTAASDISFPISLPE